MIERALAERRVEGLVGEGQRVRPAAHPARPAQAVRDRRSVAWDWNIRAIAVMRAEGSAPITRAPARARATESCPTPLPTSRTRRPDAGRVDARVTSVMRANRNSLSRARLVGITSLMSRSRSTTRMGRTLAARPVPAPIRTGAYRSERRFPSERPARRRGMRRGPPPNRLRTRPSAVCVRKIFRTDGRRRSLANREEIRGLPRTRCNSTKKPGEIPGRVGAPARALGTSPAW